MKIQAEIEAAICIGIARFKRTFMGRGPTKIQSHLVGDLLIVQLRGVLTEAEMDLARSIDASKGKDLVKEIRHELVEAARPIIQAIIHDVTGVDVLSLAHDINTTNGEELLIFNLARPPAFLSAP